MEQGCRGGSLLQRLKGPTLSLEKQQKGYKDSWLTHLILFSLQKLLMCLVITLSHFFCSCPRVFDSARERADLLGPGPALFLLLRWTPGRITDSSPHHWS